MIELLTNPKITLKEALKLLEATGKKCVIIVNKENKLLGTLTDGDLRKHILSGKKLDQSIKKFYNSNPTFFFQNKLNLKNAKKEIIKNRYELVPIVNENKIVVDVITWDQALSSDLKISKSNLKVSVVIMAGGKGTRMQPFTHILPKPLIPIKGKAIIEHIVDKFCDYGVRDFHISVNYKSSLMEAYFKELKPKYKISFIKESIPLGTVGILKKLNKQFDQPVFVSNSDVIVNTDFIDIYDYHKKHKNKITVVASAKNYEIPYGVCKIDKDGNLNNIAEKPKFNFLVNTGLYIINPEILKLIPKNKKFDMTDLIKKAKSSKKKIGVYPVDEDSWIDIGQWNEYKLAVDKLNNY